jgi:hypothetical protein
MCLARTSLRTAGSAKSAAMTMYSQAVTLWRIPISNPPDLRQLPR